MNYMGARKMKNFLEKKYLFKECKKCPVKKQNKEKIINPCQNCIDLGQAVPPQEPQVEVKYNK